MREVRWPENPSIKLGIGYATLERPLLKFQASSQLVTVQNPSPMPYGHNLCALAFL